MSEYGSMALDPRPIGRLRVSLRVGGPQVITARRWVGSVPPVGNVAGCEIEAHSACAWRSGSKADVHMPVADRHAVRQHGGWAVVLPAFPAAATARARL